MYMNDKELLEQISYEKNHAPNSKKIYNQAVKKYTSLFSMSLTELLQEADDEEEAGIRWKKRKLRKRLLIFRNYLYENYKENTAKIHLNSILSIYRHLEFELQPLPKISLKQNAKEKPMEYKDLPDKLIIREALRRGTLLMKSVILFITSSGTSRADTLNLRVSDYIEATRNYHKLDTDDIYEVIDKLEELEKQETLIIPRFNIQRQKTGVYYFTFASPEFVSITNTYLKKREELLKPYDPLFKVSGSHFNKLFREMNDNMGLGYVGTYRRFRSHMLRKYHASNLKLGEHGLSEEIVNELQGRVKAGVNQNYFFERVDDIRAKYIQALPNILINWEIESLTVQSEEFKELQKEVDALKDEKENQKQIVLELLREYGAI